MDLHYVGVLGEIKCHIALAMEVKLTGETNREIGLPSRMVV